MDCFTKSMVTIFIPEAAVRALHHMPINWDQVIVTQVCPLRYYCSSWNLIDFAIKLTKLSSCCCLYYSCDQGKVTRLDFRLQFTIYTLLLQVIEINSVLSILLELFQVIKDATWLMVRYSSFTHIFVVQIHHQYL